MKKLAAAVERINNTVQTARSFSVEAAAMQIVVRDIPVNQMTQYCTARCQWASGTCSGCAHGGRTGWRNNPNFCVAYIRNDISGAWRDWVIQHEIGHCRHG